MKTWNSPHARNLTHRLLIYGALGLFRACREVGRRLNTLVHLSVLLTRLVCDLV